jgi:hypothetical protein
VKDGVVEFIEVLDAEQWKERTGGRVFLRDEFPGCLVLFGAVAAGEIEGQLVMIGLGDELIAITEAFHFVELLLHEVVHGFDICLEAMLSGRDGSMHQSFDALDRLGDRLRLQLRGARYGVQQAWSHPGA